MNKVRDLIFAAAAAGKNGGQGGTIMCIIQKIGDERNNKRETLIADETGSLAIKEWISENKKTSFANFKKEEVMHLTLQMRLYNDEIYGSVLDILPITDENRELELLNWYEEKLNSVSSDCPNLQDLPVFNYYTRFLQVRGVIVFINPSTAPNRPSTMIIADETGTCSVVIWNYTDLSNEMLGQLLSIENSKPSSTKDNQLQLIVDELCNCSITDSEQSKTWYQSGAYRNVSPIKTPEKTDDTSSNKSTKPSTSATVATTSATTSTITKNIGNNAQTEDSPDAYFIKSLKATFDSKQDKTTLAKKMFDAFVENNVNFEKDGIHFFKFMTAFYSQIQDQAVKKTVKRKLFDTLES